MGTRCLTIFKDHEDTEICVMYRQFDGYLEGHGVDLKAWADGKKLVNGIRGDYNSVWNGMGCLAASCVANFKKDAGNIYLHPPGTRECWEDYRYTLYPEPEWDPNDEKRDRDKGGQLCIKVEDIGYQKTKTIYEGLMKDFDPKEVSRELSDE